MTHVLLPTPTTRIVHGAGTSGRDGGLEIQTAVARLLPSPRASDGEKAGPNMRGSSGDPMLPSVIAQLKFLPTPAASLASAGSKTRGNERSGELLLAGLIERVIANGGIDWGIYDSAIQRWESIFGPHPFPANFGPRGGIKPSAEFVEWMMGVPSGWISTVPGLTLNEKLKLGGNGVVPPQAEYAIRWLLSQTPQRKEEMMTDTSSFFTTQQKRDVPRDQWKRYILPDPITGEPMEGATRATTFAATVTAQHALRIWEQRQVAWGFSRRPDLVTLLSTISGPEDKKALGAIVDEAHIAAGTKAKANRGTSIHNACHSAERGAFELVPEELRPHVAGYFKALKEWRLQVIPEYVERTVYLPEYHVAGTFDNLLMCPDGKLRVGDKKTGRLDMSDVEYAIQMALYANAKYLFNYDTNRYEPMPEIAKDYAILMHIDPETGHCEPQRINIQWGWTWALTAAQVMEIRKTKNIITPMIPWAATPAANQMPPHAAPPMDGHMTGDGPVVLGRPAEISTTPVEIGTVPGSYVDTTSSVPDEFQAFWSDSRHDLAGHDATVNGVPVAQYGQPNVHPCGRGEPCEFTGNDGLHVRTWTSGCAPRPGPIPPMPHTPPSPNETNAVTSEGASLGGYEITGQTGVTDAVLALVRAPEPTEDELTRQEMTLAERSSVSNVDAIAEKLNKLSKAHIQAVARNLMSTFGIKEGDPGSIKVAQYKSKVANAIITMAFERGVPIPGVHTGDAPFGDPTGPAPTNSASGSTAQKASDARSVAEVENDQAAKDSALRLEKIRTAVTSINQQGTVAGLQERHEYYSQTSIGWTDEMQNAARVRAAQLDAEAGESPLSPLAMIQGATSMETLSLAWSKATADNTNPAGWTEELNAAAMSKQAELSAVASSGNQ